MDKFFSRLIDCLETETKIIIAKQYYYGLGLHQKDIPLSQLKGIAPDEILDVLVASNVDRIDFGQLHGRIYLEYCAVMIRAQWDKVMRLCCLVFDVDFDWDSISDGLKKLAKKLNSESSSQSWPHYHARIFLEIAESQVAEDGWLKKFRDPLLHNVGQHSLGVLPNRRSLETTSQIWEKVLDEHNWLREGIMALLIAFIGKTLASESN